MKYSLEELLDLYHNKIGLYKEGRAFFLTQVIDIEVQSEDTCFLHLKMVQDAHATFAEEGHFRFYEHLPQSWEDNFSFGGKNVSFQEDSIYVMYIGELIFDEELVNQFIGRKISLIENFF